MKEESRPLLIGRQPQSRMKCSNGTQGLTCRRPGFLIRKFTQSLHNLFVFISESTNQQILQITTREAGTELHNGEKRYGQASIKVKIIFKKVEKGTQIILGPEKLDYGWI